MMYNKKIRKKGQCNTKLNRINHILVTKLKDNKCINLTTNFDNILPLYAVHRRSVEKKFVKVNQPRAISTDTSFKERGDVGLHD